MINIFWRLTAEIKTVRFLPHLISVFSTSCQLVESLAEFLAETKILSYTSKCTKKPGRGQKMYSDLAFCSSPCSVLFQEVYATQYCCLEACEFFLLYSFYFQPTLLGVRWISVWWVFLKWQVFHLGGRPTGSLHACRSLSAGFALGFVPKRLSHLRFKWACNPAWQPPVPHSLEWTVLNEESSFFQWWKDWFFCRRWNVTAELGLHIPVCQIFV